MLFHFADVKLMSVVTFSGFAFHIIFHIISWFPYNFLIIWGNFQLVSIIISWFWFSIKFSILLGLFLARYSSVLWQLHLLSKSNPCSDCWRPDDWPIRWPYYDWVYLTQRWSCDRTGAPRNDKLETCVLDVWLGNPLENSIILGIPWDSLLIFNGFF